MFVKNYACTVHNKSTNIGLQISVMSFEFKHNFYIYNHRFLKHKFENHKPMIVNLKPRF